MRRVYAFEAEELSPEVKSQLEKVEDVVEDKCDTPEACDTMIEKINDEQTKFNDALKGMASAAKDCQDGKCDKAEMAAQITPKMAELKEVAKNIGVASEGDTLTEAELKDAKNYLEGAREIVEAKKDELESEGEKKDDDDEKKEECENGECKNGEECDGGCESFLSEECAAMEAFGRNRKRTVDMDDMAVVKAWVEKNAGSIKSGDEVVSKMKEAIAAYDAQMKDIPNALNLSIHTIADMPVIVTASSEGKVIDVQYSTGAPRFKAVEIGAMRSAVGKGLRAEDKAAKKAAKKTAKEPAADATEAFLGFVDACESLMCSGVKAEDSKAPYLFG